MKVDIGSVICSGDMPELPGAEIDFWPMYLDNKNNSLSPCEAYQKLTDVMSVSTKPEVIVFVHNDVTIHNPNWLQSVIITFEEHPNCVAVGLGGATGLGNKDLYRKPFNIWNMARTGYASNQTDAEVHGERFSDSRMVAVLDAFFMAVQTDFLKSVGGWPVDRLTHHCLDLWLACEARRARKETWMVGVDCTHHGGGTSTKPTYAEAKWLRGGSMEQDHIQPHIWLWDNYRDVLPLSCSKS